MSRFELFVGSRHFWQKAKCDMGAARHRLLVQAMTFEGDVAGNSVATAIIDSTAGDRRVLVDDYSRHVINDTFLALTRDSRLHAEAHATKAMFDAIQKSGAGLRLTNPVGRNPLRYPLRNHKKLIVADGIAWIGGMNFSDHNFAWHDLMIRIADEGIAEWLAEAFDRDWMGRPETAVGRFGPELDLIDLDGRNNAGSFQPVLAQLREAKRSIEVVSAYPSFPFVDALAAAAEAGVSATIYTPRPNNKPIIRDYLLGVVRQTGVEIRLVEEMTHVKAALIDGEVLIAGSSNFDFVSYRANAEYVAIIRDPSLLADFSAKLLAPLQMAAVAPGPREYSRWRSLKARLGLNLADAALTRLRHGPRIAEWCNR